MITEKTIIEAYLFLLRNNMSVPDETLDFMKVTALEKLQESKVENLDIKRVSQQRELLLAFLKWYNKEFTNHESLPDHLVDDFISNL